MTKIKYEIVIKDVERIPSTRVVFTICRIGTNDVMKRDVVLAPNIEDGDIMGELKKYVGENINSICKVDVVGTSDYVEVDDGV